MEKQRRMIIIFFIKAIALYLIWYFLYENWLMKVGWVDDIVIDNLVFLNNKILILLGYTTYVYEHTMGIDGSHGVYIGAPCDGIDLMALFAGFVIIFSGKVSNKLWFIPLGVVIIHLLNLLRVLALTLVAHYSPQYLDFNHKYTFTLLLYSVVFLGWVIWVKKFAVTT